MEATWNATSVKSRQVCTAPALADTDLPDAETERSEWLQKRGGGHTSMQQPLKQKLVRFQSEEWAVDNQKDSAV